jgi:hypothetical protein
MKRQVDKLRQEEDLRYAYSSSAGGYPYYPPVHPPPFAPGVFGDEQMYDHAVSIANMRSALAVQQAEIEDLQRVKRELQVRATSSASVSSYRSPGSSSSSSTISHHLSKVEQALSGGKRRGETAVICSRGGTWEHRRSRWRWTGR